MENTNTIVKHLGSAAIEKACDVSEYSVRAAKRSGSFPASWFNAIDNLCRSAGIDCPRDIFNFKGCSDGATTLETIKEAS